MDYIIRKAQESDCKNIAFALTKSFEKIFSAFTKDMELMAKVFENGITFERFFVAEQNSKIIGIIGCGDCKRRVIKSTKEECKKYLGYIKGNIVFCIIKKELMRPLTYPETTGNIDVVGVLAEARGKGLAKELLKEIMENNPQYNEFILEVDSINTSAIKSYTDFGFIEYKREPIIKFFKRSRIFMRYEKHRVIKELL